MKLICKITSIFLCVLTLQSCVEEITLFSDFEPTIFIFGNLSNENDYVRITVLESTPVTDNSKKSVIDAEISLFMESNNVQTLVTKDFDIDTDKSYKSSEKINPIIGNYYWIEVKLQDGTTFKSSKEKLLVPVEISKITYKNDSLKVYFEDPKDTPNYYGFRSTHHINNFYEIENDALYDGNKEVYIETIAFFSGNTSNIYLELSSMNFETYQFFVTLSDKESDSDIEEEGGPSLLFSSPPVNLTGNITNTKTNKKVLGNFGVISNSRPASLNDLMV